MPPPALTQPPRRPQVPPVSPHSPQALPVSPHSPQALPVSPHSPRVPPVAPRSPLSPRHASAPWTLRGRGATGASPAPPPREAAVPPAPPLHTQCPGRWVPVSTGGSPLPTRVRPSADLRPPSPVSTATAQPPRRGPEARGLEEPRWCRSGLSSRWFAGRPWAGATTEASGQSGAVQHGGARGGGGGGGAEVPPSRRGDAGSAFPSLLRPPGRPGLALRRLRGRLVPALARRLLPGRQRPHLQLAPGADGDRHGGAVRRSRPDLPPAPRPARPQAPLEGCAQRAGPGRVRPGRAGAGGCFSLPQRPRHAKHVLAAQLAGAGHCAALLLPVGGRFQHLPAALGSQLVPRLLQTCPRFLWCHRPHAVGGLMRVGDQREAVFQPEERDDRVQAPAGRGCVCQHAGAPHHPFRGAGAGRPGPAQLETPRRRLPGLSPAPAQRRALTPEDAADRCSEDLFLPLFGPVLAPCLLEDAGSRSMMLLPVSSGPRLPVPAGSSWFWVPAPRRVPNRLPWSCPSLAGSEATQGVSLCLSALLSPSLGPSQGSGSFPGPLWTCNKLMASAASLCLHPWGQRGHQELRWVPRSRSRCPRALSPPSTSLVPTSWSRASPRPLSQLRVSLCCGDSSIMSPVVLVPASPPSPVRGDM